MPARPLALLVQPPGPARRVVAGALRAEGLAVRTADEPYEGTARFVERPCEMVVCSLAAFGRGDLPFLRTVRRRAPGTRILLLVPSGKRRAALHALEAGADAWIPEPCYPEEVRALVRALRREEAPAARDAKGPDLGALASEVAHAVGNPLQVLSLLAEEVAAEGHLREGLRAEVARIRDVVRLLDRFGHLGRPLRLEGRIGPLLRERVAEREEAGRVHAVGPPPRDGPALVFDRGQIGHALDALLDLMAARAPAPPDVRARVRARRHEGARHVEAALLGVGVRLGEEEVASLRRHVIASDEESRRAHAGLALPEAVARLHGGVVLARAHREGSVLGLLLPA